MIKRLGFAFLGLLLANTAFAGLYVGAGGGYQSFTAQRYSFTLPNLFPDSHPITTTYAKGTGSTGIGNFFLGYEFKLGQYVGIGFESVFQPGKVEAKITRTQVTNDTVTLSETYTKTLQNSWGFNAKPAVYLGDATKLFGTIGWQQARVKTGNRREHAKALVLGFGMEVALPVDGSVIDSPLAVRAEYAMADYNAILRFGPMRTHSALLSLVYKF